MRTVASFSLRLVAFLLTLAVFGAFFGLALLFTSVPDAREEIHLPTLSAPVSVTLDSHGVPRVQAASERDAVVALGYLHARDRMFQMEMMRRGAEGRLAEIAGPAALRLDRFSRLLGLAQRARDDLEGLAPETRDLLEAYAQGVNALLEARGRLAAPEFIALGEPEPWKPEDSLLWAKVLGLWLSGDWRGDILRGELAPLLSAERFQALFPDGASALRPDLAGLPPGHAGRVLAAVPVFGVDAPHPSSASNAWAVSAARSASGAPLLANDPHLGFQAPIMWYLARIDLPDGRFRAGATVPGAPFMVIGRNERLAWGFTTTQSDTQDVFVERLAGDGLYETPDGPRPFTRREERIRIRGQAEEVMTVRETRHGPVVSDLDARPDQPGGSVLAVAMANLAPRDTAADALLALNRATSVAEARAAAARFSSPPQTLTVADAAGRIAQYLVGRTPIRRAGDGSVPRPGWDGAADWTGFVPFDAMPHAEDPPGGVLAAANSRPVPPGGPVFLGRAFPGDWRLRRIATLLRAAPKHEAEGFARMQMDVVSTFAEEVLPVLRAVPASAEAAPAQALLRDWDGRMEAGLPQPLIFHAWMLAFRREALALLQLPPDLDAGGAEFLSALLRPDGAAAWCGADRCAALLSRSLDQAVRSLGEAQGRDPAAWRWGSVHVARFEHPLLRFVPVLGRLTRLEAETSGDGETVSRGGFRGTGPTPFAHVHGAGLRVVFDLADPEGVLAMIATGQSGNPLSDHWGDLLERWRDGDVLRLGRVADREAGLIRLSP